MNTIMTVATETPISKDQILDIARVVNSVFGEKVIGGKGKKVATISEKDGYHLYDFSLKELI